MLSQAESEILVERCKLLPPARQAYPVHDYVTNLLLVVLDIMLPWKIVVEAHEHYQARRASGFGTHEMLRDFLARDPDDREGNTALAQYLSGSRNRIELLRKLVAYFDSIGVTTQEGLREWARTGDFDRDSKGRIPGLKYPVYKWLVKRLKVETIKPDEDVRRFVESALGRRMSDQELVETLEGVAKELGLKAYELDWRIWESQRAQAQPGGTPP